jgi:hemoglobin
VTVFPAPGPDFYDEVGGRPVFADLVRHFYAGVATDPVLRPLYPEDDLAPAAQRLQLFLEQYWGGPTDYQELRGHPRLRMRHAPFAVTPTARVHWLTHMRAALDSLDLPPRFEQPLWTYLRNAADMMVNTEEPAGGGTTPR